MLKTLKFVLKFVNMYRICLKQKSKYAKFSHFVCIGLTTTGGTAQLSYHFCTARLSVCSRSWNHFQIQHCPANIKHFCKWQLVSPIAMLQLGQQFAKRVLSVAVYNHYKRLSSTIEKKNDVIDSKVKIEVTVEHKRHTVTAIVSKPQFYNPKRKTSNPVQS